MQPEQDYEAERAFRIIPSPGIAIIAIVRGVILLDPPSMNALNIFGTAAIIFALCSGYYFLKKGRAQATVESHYFSQALIRTIIPGSGSVPAGCNLIES